jgi:hypothetical protein
MPLEVAAAADPTASALEADLLARQRATMSLGLQAAASELVECVKLLREHRRGAEIDLIRAFNAATDEERAWLIAFAKARVA